MCRAWCELPDSSAGRFRRYPEYTRVCLWEPGPRAEPTGSLWAWQSEVTRMLGGMLRIFPR